MRLAYKPFSDDPTKVLNFEGQPPGKPRPDLHVAYLDSVEFMGLTIPVDDRDLLNTAEVASLALAGLEAANQLIIESTTPPRKIALRDPRPHHLHAAYSVLGVAANTRAARCHATGIAFRRGIFLAAPETEQSCLMFPPLLYERFLLLAPLLAKGKSLHIAGEILDKSYGCVLEWRREIRRRMGLGSVGMVMLAGGLGLIPQDEEP